MRFHKLRRRSAGHHGGYGYDNHGNFGRRHWNKYQPIKCWYCAGVVRSYNQLNKHMNTAHKDRPR